MKIPWKAGITYKEIFQIFDLSLENIKKIELVRKLNDEHYESYILNNFEEGFFDFYPNDYLTIQLFNSYAEMKTVFVKGAVSSPGLYPLLGENESLNSILNRSGGLNPSIELTNVTVKRDTFLFGSLDGNISLMPNDTIIANEFEGTISIEGEVHNPGKIEWKENRVAKDYINLSGGLTAYGDKKHIVYIAPFGEAVKINNKSNRYILPGSKIIINQKPLNELNVPPDRFQQLSSLLTSFVTIAILANTVNNSN